MDSIGTIVPIPSPIGTYVPDSGSSEYTTCPTGRTTIDPGSTSDTDCTVPDSGHFMADGEILPCPLGTYQPEPGQGSCLDAGPGHYVDLEGQSDQFSCPVGSFNPDNSSISQDSCILSYYGHFVSIRGQSEVEPCAIGSYQPSLGQEGCLEPREVAHHLDGEVGTGQRLALEDRAVVRDVQRLALPQDGGI